VLSTGADVCDGDFLEAGVRERRGQMC